MSTTSTSETPTADAYAGPPPEPRLAIGTPVSKQGGDYRFDGTVVACFEKLSGAVRYAVEDDGEQCDECRGTGEIRHT